MAVYYINSYNITDWEEYQTYGPKVLPLFQKYGAQILAADTSALSIEGEAKAMHAVIQFPSQEAALRCYNDPEYQAVKNIRLNSTTDCTIVLARQWNNG